MYSQDTVITKLSIISCNITFCTSISSYLYKKKNVEKIQNSYLNQLSVLFLLQSILFCIFVIFL